jgi:hypothetical protein
MRLLAGQHNPLCNNRYRESACLMRPQNRCRCRQKPQTWSRLSRRPSRLPGPQSDTRTQRLQICQPSCSCSSLSWRLQRLQSSQRLQMAQRQPRGPVPYARRGQPFLATVCSVNGCAAISSSVNEMWRPQQPPANTSMRRNRFVRLHTAKELARARGPWAASRTQRAGANDRGHHCQCVEPMPKAATSSR